VNILKALADGIFGKAFTSDNRAAWRTFLAAIFAEPLPDAKLFTRCTGRSSAPIKPVREAWMVVGRRGGKSSIAALIASYLAAFHDYSDYLSPGEIGVVSIQATDRKQAKVIHRYIEAIFTDNPMLSPLLVRTTAETIELSNRITIEVVSATIRAARGHTIVAAICDEIAFWRSDDSANPDKDILASLRPAMATIPESMLICLSSPYARRGALWETYKDYFGQDSDDILVWQAESHTMNPTLSDAFLSREQQRDPASYLSEYLAQFRTDVAAAIDPDWIDNALVLPNRDCPKSPHSRPYKAFVDMSGGRSDAATIAVAHMEPDDPTVYVDALRRFTPPFSPESVVEQMCVLAKAYGVNGVIGDNYSAELVVELFGNQTMGYIRSTDTASEIYLQALPLFSTGKLQVPDHPTLRQELTCLERRTRTSGKDLITHPPKQHDDLANAVCGAIINAWRQRTQEFEFYVVPSPYIYDGALSDEAWGLDQ
jgi:hypothetical protein